jgi:hypothetical protein
MVAALWANSNFDDTKGTRKNAIDEIEENFEQAVEMILAGPQPEEEAAIDEDNPFFAPVKRQMAKLEAPRQDEGSSTVKDVVGDEYARYIDQ